MSKKKSEKSRGALYTLPPKGYNIMQIVNKTGGKL